ESGIFLSSGFCSGLDWGGSFGAGDGDCRAAAPIAVQSARAAISESRVRMWSSLFQRRPFGAARRFGAAAGASPGFDSATDFVRGFETFPGRRGFGADAPAGITGAAFGPPLPALRRAAFSMIDRSRAPVSPPSTGRLVF